MIASPWRARAPATKVSVVGFETLPIWDQKRVGATPDLGDLANTHAVPVRLESLHTVNGLAWRC